MRLGKSLVFLFSWIVVCIIAACAYSLETRNRLLIKQIQANVEVPTSPDVLTKRSDQFGYLLSSYQEARKLSITSDELDQFARGNRINRISLEQVRSLAATCSSALSKIVDPVVLSNCSWFISLLDQQGKAIETAERAVAGAPNDYLIRLSAGLIFERNGSVLEASREYSSALILRPRLITSSFWSRLRLRNDSLAQGAAAKTLEILERSIANDPSAASKLARLYFEEKQYSRAEELSKRALSSFESLQGAWITLGDCQAQRRAFDDARISFLKARSLDPADPVPFLRLAELARITGRPQFAVQLLAAARDRFKQRSTEHAKRYWLTMSSSVFVRNDMFPSALLPEAAEYGGEIASLKRIRDIASQLQQVQFVELVDDCLSSRSLP